MIPIMIREYKIFTKSNARSNKSHNKEKQLTEIMMLTHAIEKGFSLPNLRKSFGSEKALRLSCILKKFISKFGFEDSLKVPIALLKQYLLYHNNNNIVSEDLRRINYDIEYLIEQSHLHNIQFDEAGTFDKTKEDMLSLTGADFKTLAEGRYSIRNFDPKPVDLSLIYEALQIASKSPSACNRQAYRVHIFEGENKNKLLNIQGGTNSFYEYVDKVILITADLNRYYSLEPHLGYVDGSLFAMSLIYALTYKGIGSIPLTLGINPKTINTMKRRFCIPENEMPVLLIGIGNYAEKFKVAKSHRNPTNTFTTYHS